MNKILIQEKYVTFSIQNILILVMILFFGFTSLRFGSFGIGEVILLFFCVLQIIGKRTILVSFKKNIFSAFWFFYLLIITIGCTINSYLEISPPQSVAFDYKSYIVILFLCFTFESLFKESTQSILYSLLRFIYFWGLFSVGILYFIYLQGRIVLFGYYLTYAGSDIFSPFANDYHQFAYFVAPLPFVGLYIISKEERFMVKVLAILGILLSIEIGIATTSSTLLAAWTISSTVLVILKTREILKKVNKSTSITIFLLCLLMVCLFFNYEKVVPLISDFFHGDTNGENRLVIWSNAIKAWRLSPVFGLGPGSYSGDHLFGGYEAHNTFLQVMTQGGIVGGIVYLFMVLNITRTTFANTFILCAVISLIGYGLGINDLRRSVLWFYYILFYYISTKSKGENC